MQIDNFGTLVVKTSAAGGSLPVENSTVRIRNSSDSTKEVLYSLLTDNDGITPRVKLPAPPAGYSLSPTNQALPYGLYDIEVSSPEFYKQSIYNVAVFSGIDTILPVNMIPKSIHTSSEPYPSDETNTVIREKYLL